MKKVLISIFFCLTVQFTFAQSGWVVQNPYYTQNNIKDIYAPDTSIAIACGSGGALMRTTDSGHNWTYLNSGTSSGLNSIYFINTSTGFIAGSNGVLLKTTNTGLNWTSLTSGTSSNLYSIFFLNSTTAWAAGSGGVIIK